MFFHNPFSKPSHYLYLTNLILFSCSDDHVVGPKHIIVLRHDGGVYGRFKNVKGSKPGTKKYLKLFLRRKGIANACFYDTINLKRPSDINTRQHRINNSMKMKKEDIARGLGISKMDQTNHSGNKVLPISETTLSTNNTSTNDQSVGTSEKKEKLKGDKAKTMSRMKELLRWAAAAKSERAGKFIGRKVKKQKFFFFFFSFLNLEILTF